MSDREHIHNDEPIHPRFRKRPGSRGRRTRDVPPEGVDDDDLDRLNEDGWPFDDERDYGEWEWCSGGRRKMRPRRR